VGRASGSQLGDCKLNPRLGHHSGLKIIEENVLALYAISVYNKAIIIYVGQFRSLMISILMFNKL